MSLRTRTIFLCLLLFGAWYLLSGKADALHLGLGFATSVCIALMSMRALKRSPNLPWLNLMKFLPWHFYQVIVSNLRVAKLVMTTSRSGIQPQFIVADSSVQGDQALTLLGVAITLTPGTLTIDIDDSTMLIHALDNASASDIWNKTMAKRVAQVFDGQKI